jgi:low affinity Fe/Cu permease
MIAASITGRSGRIDMQQFFRRFAHATAVAVGTPWAFILAVGVVIAWGLTGSAAGYSDSWQLIINTGTTIVTFLMVFLIQNTQNREARVTQLKLDELIRAVKQARNRLVALEEMSDEELERIEREFHQLHVQASQLRRRRETQRTTPESGAAASP